MLTAADKPGRTDDADPRSLLSLSQALAALATAAAAVGARDLRHQNGSLSAARSLMAAEATAAAATAVVPVESKPTSLSSQYPVGSGCGSGDGVDKKGRMGGGGDGGVIVGDSLSPAVEKSAAPSQAAAAGAAAATATAKATPVGFAAAGDATVVAGPRGPIGCTTSVDATTHQVYTAAIGIFQSLAVWKRLYHSLSSVRHPTVLECCF